jgi:hypothetical protein
MIIVVLVCALLGVSLQDYQITISLESSIANSSRSIASFENLENTTFFDRVNLEINTNVVP